jgi:hypothetical protein
MAVTGAVIDFSVLPALSAGLSLSLPSFVGHRLVEPAIVRAGIAEDRGKRLVVEHSIPLESWWTVTKLH